MATNKPTGDNARKGAVKKRTQRKTKVMGEERWEKRASETGRFMRVKKAGAPKFKGVRKEAAAAKKAAKKTTKRKAAKKR